MAAVVDLDCLGEQCLSGFSMVKLLFLAPPFHPVVFFFWLHWVFVAAHGLSFLVAVSGAYSLLRYAGFSLRWLLLLQSIGSKHAGFSSCGTCAQYLWLVGSRVQAQ